MKKTFLKGHGIFFCLVFLALAALSFASSSDKEPKRSKIISYALTPSLRVGRRSEGTWDQNTDVKRRVANIMSFMRTGRSNTRNWPQQDEYGKRTGTVPGVGDGMWFGPRLGRLQKRDINGNVGSNGDEYVPWTYIILNGEGPLNRQIHYTPRLGRESEEILGNGSEQDPEYLLGV